MSIWVVALYSAFLTEERLTLIDQQVRETAAALVDSELGDLRKIDFDNADKIISEELGESRIGKFFIIKNSKDEVIFESSSASLLTIAEIPSEQQWFQTTINGKFIRGLNLKLPRIPDRTLQVGLVLDENIIQPNYISKHTLLFVFFVLVLGFLVSFILTSYLLKPISRLGDFLSEVANVSKKQTQLPHIPDSICSSRRNDSKDEFVKLVFGLETLISRVNRNYEFSRLWAYQMAHELKTPLSLVTMEIEKLQNSVDSVGIDFSPLELEIIRVSDTINSFLNWAELENSKQQKRLFLNKISEVIETIFLRMPQLKHRIHLMIESNLVVISNPQHLEQLLFNLLQNAASYSPLDSPINIQIINRVLKIQDFGNGFAPDIFKRIGEPFNRGYSANESTKGHGLGLAWVKSVCRLYDWNIEFESNKNGTTIQVTFPEIPLDRIEPKEI